MNTLKTSKDLLTELGVTHATKRHLQIVDNFLKTGNKDAIELLKQMGDWTETDYRITKQFLAEYHA